MIEYFRAVHGVLTRVDGPEPGVWVNAVSPTFEELEWLSERFGAPHDFLAYALDPDERPRYERDREFVLMVLQTSYPLGEDSDIPYDTVPLAVVHTTDALITVSSFPNPTVEDLKNGRYRGLSTTKKNRFTLQLFLRVAQRYLIDLRDLNKRVDATESRLERSTENRELLELLRLEKSLVYFKTALKANELMVERVKRDRVFEMYEDDLDLLNDVLVENLQAIEMTDIAASILSGTTGTFASVISNNVNQVVKTLTVATILVAVPTWITGVFGANVPIPGQHDPRAFAIMMVLSLVTAVLLLLVFRWRRWL